MVSAGSISCTDLADLIVGGDIVGISDDTPLGKIDRYEAFLAERGLTNNGIVKKENILGVGNAHVFIWNIVETQMGTTGKFQSKIVVIADDEGTVLAINTHHTNISKDRVRIAMKEIWIKLSGLIPDFTELIELPDTYKEPLLGNRFTGEGVRGTWVRLTFQEESVRIALNKYETDVFK
jgi:hypothetical protein